MCRLFVYLFIARYSFSYRRHRTALADVLFGLLRDMNRRNATGKPTMNNATTSPFNDPRICTYIFVSPFLRSIAATPPTEPRILGRVVSVRFELRSTCTRVVLCFSYRSVARVGECKTGRESRVAGAGRDRVHRRASQRSVHEGARHDRHPLRTHVRTSYFRPVVGSACVSVLVSYLWFVLPRCKCQCRIQTPYSYGNVRQTTEHIEFVDRAWLEPFQTSVRVTPLALTVCENLRRVFER
jgi:hypothetical protein